MSWFLFGGRPKSAGPTHSQDDEKRKASARPGELGDFLGCSSVSLTVEDRACVRRGATVPSLGYPALK